VLAKADRWLRPALRSAPKRSEGVCAEEGVSVVSVSRIPRSPGRFHRSVIAYLGAATPVFRLLPTTRDWLTACSNEHVPNPAKRFVYIIRSLNHPQKRYIGMTSDVAVRVRAHNAGQNRSTAPWKPWNVSVTIEFRTERTALRFEKYLKSGAGHAFASRHFLD
jgi:putative endonuclease